MDQKPDGQFIPKSVIDSIEPEADGTIWVPFPFLRREAELPPEVLEIITPPEKEPTLMDRVRSAFRKP